MKEKEVQIGRTCHVMYSKPCKKEIRKKIALHYSPEEQEMIWERVQLKYSEFLSDWRTDLGGKKNFHNGVGGTYDCIAVMSYYAVCKDVASFREIEEIEENLILPSFRKLKFVDCNKPFWRKLMYNHNTRIRTRLKWHINGVFWLVVAHRRQPYELLRTETLSLLCSFQVEEFCRKKNLHRQGKNAVNPVGLASILTQYVRIFLRQNRVRMRVLWLCVF